MSPAESSPHSAYSDPKVKLFAPARCQTGLEDGDRPLSLDPAEYIRRLEKENRTLKKKLQRSETERLDLEQTYETREDHLHKVIQELEQTKLHQENQHQELDKAFKQLQAMQSKLVEAEKMSALGVLVAGIAHEINNPISFIHGNVDCASSYIRSLVNLVKLYQQSYPTPSDEILRYQQDIDLEFVLDDILALLKSMRLGSDRISQIVLGLRNFSRHDESELKEANIHQGLDSTLMILQHRLRQNGPNPTIEVQKDYGKVPNIPCFAGQLNQVFMNILVNAIDALRGNGNDQDADRQQVPSPWIWIKTSLTADNMVAIRIGNNGPHIPASVQSRLFDPFFTTKPVGKGTGLGLSISHQIVVERHHGRLTCQSSCGQGCEFLIELPLSPDVDL